MGSSVRARKVRSRVNHAATPPRPCRPPPAGFLGLAALAICAVARDASADTALNVPAGGGLAAITVTIDLAAHVLHVSAAPDIPIALDASLFPSGVVATEDVIDLGGGKRVAHVTLQAKSEVGSPRNVAWEAIVAAGAPAPVFAGLTGFARGEEGERTGTLIELRANGANTKYAVRGDIREDLRICGQKRGTLLRPQVLDPKTLAWHEATFQRLSPEQRDAATHIAATRLATPSAPPLAPLLSAVGTSVPSSTGAALTDGSIETTWSEARPTEGRGEFVVMQAPSDVDLTRFTITPASSAPSNEGEAPKSVYLVSDTQTFAVALPDDGWSHPGAAYEIALPSPLRTSCMALVLDEAYARSTRPPLDNPDVSVAELTAYSAFDARGAALDDVASALGDPARSAAASSILKRAGDGALSAIAAVFDKLDASGQGLAIEVALNHPTCNGSVPLLVRVMAGKHHEPSRRAKEKLLRCGKSVVPALIETLKGDVQGRAFAAPLLAALTPKEALTALADVLGDGPRDVRASVRASFAQAANAADVDSLRPVIADRTRPPAARIDLLRGATDRLPLVRDEARAAILALLEGAPPMRTRYLLIPPLATLAHAGDSVSIESLRRDLASDPEWPVRAHAAEFASGIGPLRIALAAAARDPEPRVREAAMRAMSNEPSDDSTASATALLAHDPWTFVRASAASALATAPPTAPVDAALAAALSDTAPEVRGAAAIGLGAHRARMYRDALQARVDDEHEHLEVRVIATEALGDLCDPASLDRLTELARGASEPMPDEAQARLGAAAIESLGKIHPNDLAARLAPAEGAQAPRGAHALADRVLHEPGTCH